MIKKPQILGILFIFLVFAVFAASSAQDEQANILSKKSHAEKLWSMSAHAAENTEAFRHWDEDDPPEIPSYCAKCHSTHGFLDFIADGSVDSGHPADTTVECLVCHTDEESGRLRDHDSVEFPSGIQVEGLGKGAVCMECHQGRASKSSVDTHIEDAAVEDDDTPSASLRFQNIHYHVAAATQFGTVIKGGYEYEGKTYDARFPHVPGYNDCTTCHNPHSLEVDLENCRTCHVGVTNAKNIRYYGSFTDYDGDGDKTEGMYYEIADITGRLYTAIKRYAKKVVGVPIGYESHSYPYFFHDTNGNGTIDTEEANYGNSYKSFTPRLIKAAYNFQVSKKDPNSYAHGGKYVIQLLYDSLEDLNSQLKNPVNTEGFTRGDEGHFDGSTEAWRHWDEDGEVPSYCARCHTADGLAYYLENGTNDVALATANGMVCVTCHTSPPGLLQAGPVTFPSGKVRDMGDSSNLCMNCHQGRASKNSVKSAIAASEGPYGFINIHYFPAAAILFGTEVKGGFEYPGKTYTGQKIFANHAGLFDTCVECPMGTNSFNENLKNHNVRRPNPADCVLCHGQDVAQPNPGGNSKKFSFNGIRPATTPDYDGDGNKMESIKNEIKGLEKKLYKQIQAYAFAIGSPIIYDSHAYPYFFHDTNGNGESDPGEAIYPNKYNFNAKLLKAAYNYQTSKKEPHGFIHNSLYVAQLLVDSIGDLGGDVSPYTWR